MFSPDSSRFEAFEFQGETINLAIKTDSANNETTLRALIHLHGCPIQVTLNYNSDNMDINSAKNEMEVSLRKAIYMAKALNLGGSIQSLKIYNNRQVEAEKADGRIVIYSNVEKALKEKKEKLLEEMKTAASLDEQQKVSEKIDKIKECIKHVFAPAIPERPPPPLETKPIKPPLPSKDQKPKLRPKEEYLKKPPIPNHRPQIPQQLKESKGKEKVSIQDNEPLLIASLSDEEFSNEEFEILRVYASIIVDVKQDPKKRLKLSKEDKEQIAHLYEKALGNPAINKQISKILKKGNGLSDSEKAVLQALKEFSFRTRQVELLQERITRLSDLFEKIKDQEAILDEEKLSLEELGALEILKINEDIEFIDLLRLGDLSANLSGISNLYKQRTQVLKEVEEALNKYSNYKAGDLIFTNGDKLAKFKSVKATFSEKLKTKVLRRPLHHAAVCIKSEKENVSIDLMSHVVQGYERDDFGVRDKTISSCYRLDPSQLISETALPYLEEIYGDEGKDLVAEMSLHYQKIQNELHQNRDLLFSSFRNPQSRRIKSGFAEFLKFLHKKIPKNRRLNELYQKYYGQDQEVEENRILCSEFAAHTIIAGLLKQEEEIKEKLLKHYGEEVEEMKIFKFPFPNSQKLSTLNTTRLLDLLIKKGCVEKIEPQPLIQMLVKAKDLEQDPREEIIPTSRISGFDKGATHLKEMRSIGELEKAPSAPPKNPTIADKWCNIDEGVVKTKCKILLRNGQLYPMIKQRRAQIREIKEAWRDKISSELLPEAKQLEAHGKLIPVEGGMGGAYFLADDDEVPQYVVKPLDEDILALNNRKCKATPFSGDDNRMADRVRRGIPLYTSVQSEVLSYQVAALVGLSHITPKVEMTIFQSDSFYDVMDDVKELKGEKGPEVLEAVGGPPDKEKLCSIQEYIPNSKDLLDLLSDIGARDDLTEEEKDQLMSSSIVLQDFEDCLIFSCVVGESDGNSGNYRVQEMGADEKGNPLYRFFKIDNALTFSENNEFNLFIDDMLLGENPLSQKGKELINSINEEKIALIVEKLVEFGKSEKAIQMFQKRIKILKEAANLENATLAEIAQCVRLLSLSDTTQEKEATRPSESPDESLEIPSETRIIKDSEENIPVQKKLWLKDS